MSLLACLYLSAGLSVHAQAPTPPKQYNHGVLRRDGYWAALTEISAATPGESIFDCIARIKSAVAELRARLAAIESAVGPEYSLRNSEYGDDVGMYQMPKGLGAYVEKHRAEHLAAQVSKLSLDLLAATDQAENAQLLTEHLEERNAALVEALNVVALLVIVPPMMTPQARQLMDMIDLAEKAIAANKEHP